MAYCQKTVQKAQNIPNTIIKTINLKNHKILLKKRKKNRFHFSKFCALFSSLEATELDLNKKTNSKLNI